MPLRYRPTPLADSQYDVLARWEQLLTPSRLYDWFGCAAMARARARARAEVQPTVSWPIPAAAPPPSRGRPPGRPASERGRVVEAMRTRLRAGADFRSWKGEAIAAEFETSLATAWRALKEVARRA